MRQLETDFLGDWRSIMADQLTTLGYGVPTTDSLEAVSIKYWSVTHRTSDGTIVASYVTAIFMPIIGFILGIYLLFKDRPGHGVTVLILTVVSWVIWSAIFGLAYLSVMMGS